jgi:DNA-directed RNA polymerase subunit RPC12/RpoP
MVQVISTKPHASVVKETVCRKCGATLAYTPLDVIKDYISDYTGSRDDYNYIICPNCENKIQVK